MLCRDCGQPTRVTHTDKQAEFVRRRRACRNGHRFWTREEIVHDADPYIPERGGPRA